MDDLTLAQKKCRPCEGGVPSLAPAECKKLLKNISKWTLAENRLQKEYRFKNFKQAMLFVNRLAEIAESEGHHPDIFIQYNQVRLTLWTHAVEGLTENDFILAAKTDEIPT